VITPVAGNFFYCLGGKETLGRKDSRPEILPTDNCGLSTTLQVIGKAEQCTWLSLEEVGMGVIK
jgi:hypothetical protein